MFDVNYLAILVCGIVSILLGALWYGPLFGKPWMALMGFSLEGMKHPENKKKANKGYAMSFVGALVMAFVFALQVNPGAAASSWTMGLQGGFWTWLGFVAPVTLSAVLWEGKPWKLFVINTGYTLVQLLLMGIILAIWP